jgi:hypothetical protein
LPLNIASVSRHLNDLIIINNIPSRYYCQALSRGDLLSGTGSSFAAELVAGFTGIRNY